MSIKKKIRVLVVDDSLLFREAIVRGLSNDAGIEVVGSAQDAFSARDKILELEPDVMTLDVEMPKMSGVEFLKKLMPQYPLPVVMVTSLSSSLFDALNAGAVDFVSKPDIDSKDDIPSFINELIIKVKIASTAKVGHHKKELRETTNLSGRSFSDRNTIVAIGASTGGTEATLEVIKNLPREMPGIVIVQHMPPVFTKMYADRLNNICKIEVKEARDGDEVLPGRALIAPGSFQMQLIKKQGRYFVKCFEGEKVNGHCPSVDVLFDSVASVAKENAIGIILTGMGNDGAKGL
ncbi:MAG TPA: chemotaxis-specific protein-glutamate methyltransferase CheB, partial [Clostridia bacterium]|nr:chemotaxis-specific protein-glutamate methyltransferase CheB [Clostridia bacterium]